jgi:carbonic anhydrase
MGSHCSQQAEDNEEAIANMTITNEMPKEEIVQLFGILDKNQSNKLDYNEFSSLWNLVGLKPNSKEVKARVFRDYDKNNDGAVDMQEFMGFIEALENKEAVDVDFHWGYTKKNGPAVWKKHFPDACGKEQSPIDIKLKSVKENAKAPQITVHYKDCKAVCLNNGHTVQWGVEDAGYIMIGDKRFNLAQFHYHCPSEHKLNGKVYPICFHFVHQAEDGTLAVFGHLFEYGVYSHPFLDAITSNAPVQPHDSVDLESIPFEKLKIAGDYVHYDGSLTTPPCSEKVLWYVNKDIMQISRPQEAWFRSCVKHDTARPCQKLNGRLLHTQTICLAADIAGAGYSGGGLPP